MSYVRTLEFFYTPTYKNIEIKQIIDISNVSKSSIGRLVCLKKGLEDFKLT